MLKNCANVIIIKLSLKKTLALSFHASVFLLILTVFHPSEPIVWIFPCFCSFEHTYFIGLEDWVHTASVSSVWPALIDQTTEETSRLLLKALCPWESAGCRRPASSNLDAWRPSENHLVLCPCSQMGSLLAQTTHHSLRGGSAPVVEHQGQGEGKTCVFREYPAWFVGSCCTRRVRPRVTYLGF